LTSKCLNKILNREVERFQHFLSQLHTGAKQINLLLLLLLLLLLFDSAWWWTWTVCDEV